MKLGRNAIMAKSTTDFTRNDLVNKAIHTPRLGIGPLVQRLGLLRAELETVRPALKPAKKNVLVDNLNSKTKMWVKKPVSMWLEYRKFGDILSEERAYDIGEEISAIKDQIVEKYLEKVDSEYAQDMKRGRKALMEDL